MLLVVLYTRHNYIWHISYINRMLRTIILELLLCHPFFVCLVNLVLYVYSMDFVEAMIRFFSHVLTRGKIDIAIFADLMTFDTKSNHSPYAISF